MSEYYQDKIEILRDIFNTNNITLKPDLLIIEDKNYPILDDVIILMDESKYTDYVRSSLNINTNTFIKDDTSFSKDIQESFGFEWNSFDQMLDEYKLEFKQYFDLVDLTSLKDKRVCDLGCGNGRWSYLLKDSCRELILVDFSDAIFTARKNLQESDNCLFFKGDLKALPFKDDFVDFLLCLGVLHHLPTPCLDELKGLKRYAPQLLIYLYYNLENRPFYFRLLLSLVTIIRRQLSKIHSARLKLFLSTFGALVLYLPFILLGYLLKLLNLVRHVPLYEFYQGKSIKRIEQDVYDRFFTSIEQRVTVKDILELKSTFNDIVISENLPYWHFLCNR